MDCLGDGIGAEVAESVKTVFKADNVPIEWEQIDVSGVETGDKHSEELFRESIASLKRNKIGLKGMTASLFWGASLLKGDRNSAHTSREVWPSIFQRCTSSGT